MDCRLFSKFSGIQVDEGDARSFVSGNCRLLYGSIPNTLGAAHSLLFLSDNFLPGFKINEIYYVKRVQGRLIRELEENNIRIWRRIFVRIQGVMTGA